MISDVFFFFCCVAGGGSFGRFDFGEATGSERTRQHKVAVPSRRLPGPKKCWGGWVAGWYGALWAYDLVSRLAEKQRATWWRYQKGVCWGPGLCRFGGRRVVVVDVGFGVWVTGLCVCAVSGILFPLCEDGR